MSCSQRAASLDPRRFRSSDVAVTLLWFAGTMVLQLLAASGGDAGSTRLVVRVLLAGTLAGIALDAARDLRAIFRAKNLTLLFVFYWVLLNVVQWTPDVAALSPYQVTRAAAHYCLFVSVFLVSYLVLRGSRRVARFVVRSIPPLSRRFIVLTALGVFGAELVRRLAFVGFDPAALVAETLKGRSGPVAFGRGRFGDWRVFLEPIERLFTIQPLLGTVAWDFIRSAAGRLLLVASVAATLLTFFFGGSRGRLALPVILLLAYRFLSADRQRRRWWLVAFVAATLLLAPAMDLMVRYRTQGWDLARIELTGVAANPLKAARDTNFSAMARLMSAVDVEGYRSPFEFYFFMVISPIPRVIWPSKPYMSQDYLGDVREYYASVSSVGDMYLYGGLPHVVAGACLLGWFVKALDLLFPLAVRRREWLLAYLLLLWAPVVSLRAIWSLVVYAQLLVLAWILLRVVRRREVGPSPITARPSRHWRPVP